MNFHKITTSWFVDTKHFIKSVIISLKNKEVPDHYLGHVLESKAAILIIPGIFTSWKFLKKISDDLSIQGHPVYTVPKLKYNLFDIPNSAKIASDLIQSEGLKRVIIVAHSKGGLIGKYMLIHHNYNKVILGMISLATPFSGSAMAKLLPIKPTKELRTDSLLINELKNNKKVNSQIVSIFPAFDHYVPNKNSSHLDGAENICLNMHGHHTILYDSSTIHEVKKWVEKMSDLKNKLDLSNK